MKQSIYFAFILFLVCSACGRNKSPRQPDIDSELVTLDAQKGEFKPDYFRDPQNAHIAVALSFRENRFTLVPGAATMRPGRPPYLAGDTAKAFVVRFRNANGALAGSYSFDHPALLRACEGKNPGVSFSDSVRFDILIPAGKGITQVELTEKGKRSFSFTIPPVRNTLGDTVRVNTNRTDTLR